MKMFAPLFMVGFLMLAGAGCNATGSLTGNTNTAAPTTPSSATTPAAEVTGRAVFAITDEAASLADVTSVVVTIDRIQAHTTSSGWVTVSTGVKQYDLVQLKNTGVSKLLADINLPVGTYGQLRMDISKAVVTAAGKTQEAKLPSSRLLIVGNFTVSAGQTSVAVFDFNLQTSLHLTGDGKYILSPVVQLQTKQRARVDVDANESVDVSGGEVETDTKVGMDEKGETRANFELPDKLKINVRGLIERADED